MIDPLFATAIHALTVEAGGATFIVDLREGTSIALNGAAAVIWRGLVRGRSRPQIAQDLVAAFGVDERRAQADVVAFVATLGERDLIRPGLLAQPGPAQ